ncbi:MAG: twin-arginine translocase subunit TatC [Bacillota bacterium]
MKDYEPQDLLHHLNDLRWCFIRAAAAWLIATVFGLICARSIIRMLTPAVVGDLVVLGVAEALVTQVKVGATAGAAMAAPVMLYQAWRFISPGLTMRERRALLPLTPFALIMPLLGGAFALRIVLPQVVRLLYTVSGGEWRLFLSLGQFVSFALGLMWPMALASEAPILVYFCTRLGWMGSRALAKRWRLVVVMAFAAAAVLSPGPDVTLQLLLVLPLLLLYGLCVVIARLAEGPHRQALDGQQKGSIS